MLARRIIAISPDKAFGKQLAIALKAAGGAIDSHATLDELGKGEIQAALVVIHLAGELAGAASHVASRLSGDTKMIAILPASNLSAVVDVMQVSEKLAGVLVAEELDPRRLSAMATRTMSGDLFGLDKLVPWGTRIHSQLVGDYQEKSLCIAQVSEFAELMGVRRKYREQIEACIDEMLMNALYDAPVDEEGRQIFSEIPTKTRISLRVEQKVVVQYACDGKVFSLAVRDAFGTLDRSTVVRYLYKCLHSEQQIDRKTGGAGLGLYLMASSSSQMMFNVLPGIATEAVCVFDLETPKVQLEVFGFFHEKIDAAGRLAAGPSRRLPAGSGFPVERRAATTPPAAVLPRSLIGGLLVAILAMVVLIGVVAWPRLTGPGHANVEFDTVPKGVTLEIEGRNAGTASDGRLVVDGLEIGRAYPVVARRDGYDPREVVVEPHKGSNAMTIELTAQNATVAIDSVPSGASVEIDGKAAGTTPLAVARPPHTALAVTFKKTGYHDAIAKLDVPGPGKDTRFVQPLAVADELARVVITSDPPGAHVVQNGQPVAGVTTPCELLVEAGVPQRFVLMLPGHVPAVIEPFTAARGADGLTKSAKLVESSELAVEANVEGKVTVAPGAGAGAAGCPVAATPASCAVAPGAYRVTFVGAGGAKAAKTVSIDAAGTIVKVKLEFGTVEAAAGRTIAVAGAAAGAAGVKRVVLEVGTRTVNVVDDAGTRAVVVKVKAGEKTIVE